MLTQAQVKLLEEMGFCHISFYGYVKTYGSADGEHYGRIEVGTVSNRIGFYNKLVIDDNKQAQLDLAKLKEGGIE